MESNDEDFENRAFRKIIDAKIKARPGLQTIYLCLNSNSPIFLSPKSK
jgi:hypothetical protein